MVEPYLLPDGTSASAQTPHSWQNEHKFSITERNDNANHQLVDSDDDDDDDVQFISEIRPDGSTVDLSKCIFELLNDEFVDDNSLSNLHTHRTTGQLEHDNKVVLSNPFSQTLPQITVANFAKENVLDNNGKGADAANGILDDDWLGANPSNHLPKTTVAAIAPATATITADWKWENIFGAQTSLSATNDPQPSTSNLNWHLPHTDATNSHAPAHNADNKKNLKHQIHNIFGQMQQLFPTPLSYVPPQNQPNLPKQTLPAINNPQPGPSKSNFEWHLPYTDVINSNTPTDNAANKQNLNHQIHNNFGQTLQLFPSVAIPEIIPPPSQLAKLQTSLPQLNQANLPKQTLPATKNPQLGPSTSNFEWYLPYADVINSNSPTDNLNHQTHNNFDQTPLFTSAEIPKQVPAPPQPSKQTPLPQQNQANSPKQTLPATNNPQPGPSTSNFEWYLPYADVTNINTPAHNAANKQNLNHQNQNNFGRTPLFTSAEIPTLTTPPPPQLAPHQNQVNLPKQTLLATNNPQPDPSTSNFEWYLPYADVTNINTPAHNAANKQNLNHQNQNNFGRTPLFTSAEIPTLTTPPPPQLAPHQNQVNLPQQTLPATNNPQPDPEPWDFGWHVPHTIVTNSNTPQQNTAKNKQNLNHQIDNILAISGQNQQRFLRPQLAGVTNSNTPQQLAEPLRFVVPQQDQPGPSWMAQQQRQMINMEQAPIHQPTNEQIFPPHAAMRPAQTHIPISSDIKRKNSYVVPIEVLRSTKQYETLVEMGFPEKDIETALRKCYLDLHKTIVYLNDPKIAAKRQKKDDQNTPSLFTAEIPNQNQQTYEEPNKVNAEPIKKPANLYEELLYLEDTGGIVKSIESFDCEICMETIEMKDGMILRNCLHRYCKDCLNGTIVHSDEVDIKCPYVSCEEILQDREIRAVLSEEEYEKYLMKGVRVAQVTITGTILCNLPDCNGWCICDDEVNEFKCPQCKNTNCIPCKAIHPERTCREYQDDLAAGDANGTMSGQRRSEQAIQELIDKNEAMKCFQCGILIMKRDGCDFIKCVMCKAGICWATRGPRYGPGGVGDFSGGCGCTAKKRCHKDCRGCH